MSDTILIDRDGAVMTLTLNRPDVLNALNSELAVAFGDATEQAENDPTVRCVVIRGAGKHFCAGGDINAFTPALEMNSDERRAMFRKFIHAVHPGIVTLQRMPKPVIASVRGAAAGFGFSLAAACDLTIAADNSVFTLAYSLLGTSPDGSSTYSLPRLVGKKKAMEIALLGDRFDAEEALRLGIINWVVPDDGLEAETTKLAERLAAGPTQAYGNTKSLINDSLRSTMVEQLEAEVEAFADSASAEDFPEGVAAFLGKRPADFKGR
jgi:2-(1,2-epoxy-1,2-dihydrophenyl)acetyl-CoA isomerase